MNNDEKTLHIGGSMFIELLLKLIGKPPEESPQPDNMVEQQIQGAMRLLECDRREAIRYLASEPSREEIERFRRKHATFYALNPEKAHQQIKAKRALKAKLYVDFRNVAEVPPIPEYTSSLDTGENNLGPKLSA